MHGSIIRFLRTIQLPDETLELLKQLYEHNKKKWHYFEDEYFVFGSAHPLKESNIDRHNRKYAKLAKLHHIKIHDFRASHASLLINSGANILMVSKRLGHSDIEMTLNTYSFLFDESENQVLDMINKLQEDSKK